MCLYFFFGGGRGSTPCLNPSLLIGFIFLLSHTCVCSQRKDDKAVRATISAAVPMGTFGDADLTFGLDDGPEAGASSDDEGGGGGGGSAGGLGMWDRDGVAASRGSQRVSENPTFTS